MTQRDNTAVMVSHESSASDERESLTQPISSVSASLTCEPASGSQNSESPASDQAQETVAAEDGVQETAVEAQLSSVLATQADSSRDRPTLMGLAPIDFAEATELPSSAAARRARAQADAEVETSTVRTTQLLASDAERAFKAALADEAALSGADESEAAESEGAESEGAESEAAESEAVESNASESPEPLAASADPEPPPQVSVPAQHPALGMFVPAPTRLPEEGDQEWLDLSTRWLIATGPHTEPPISDEAEATENVHWADTLSAHVAPRARVEAHSSAPLPPRQPPARRATMSYGPPPDSAGRHAIPGMVGASQAADIHGQRQWTPSGRRHQTLAGISPLPEGWDSRQAQDFRAPVDYQGPSSRPNGEPNPWSEEPSYSDGGAPQGYPPNPGYAAAAGMMPPWAAQPMPGYAPPPAGHAPQSAATIHPYAAAWNMLPPWAATANHAMPMPQLQHFQPDPYAERRPSRSLDYAPVHSRIPTRRPHAPQQQYASAFSREQWKSIANSWAGTLAKLAFAAMALHYSGLADPLFARFGYTPAADTPPAGANGAAALPAASLAAASVIPEPISAAATASDAPTSAPRRKTEKRETSAASEPSTRRYSGAKPAHKPKPKVTTTSAAQSKAPRSAPAAAAVEAPAAPSSTPEPLTAAAPKADEPAVEASLRINSRPWSQIYVDGALVGHTPKLDLRVSAGPHRIRLVNPDLGLSKTVELKAIAGQTVSHVELFID